MYSKDIERVVRMFLAQKLDLAYIRHYLQETYQLDEPMIRTILTRVGALSQDTRGKEPRTSATAPKVNRQTFY